MNEEPKKKILIVDDEEDVLSMLKLRLEAFGFAVFTASDGNSGYAAAKEVAPDLIILDLMLPGMDGYQVCRLLKFDQKYRAIPIIMLTAKSQAEDKEWGAKTGADSYFTKPFDAAQLTAKIKELVGG